MRCEVSEVSEGGREGEREGVSEWDGFLNTGTAHLGCWEGGIHDNNTNNSDADIGGVTKL